MFPPLDATLSVVDIRFFPWCILFMDILDTIYPPLNSALQIFFTSGILPRCRLLVSICIEPNDEFL